LERERHLPRTMTRLAAAQGEQKSVMIGATHLKAH
jgi:hypothetical protein